MAEVEPDKIVIVEKEPEIERSDNDINQHSSASPQHSRNTADYESISGPISYNSFAHDPEFEGIVRDGEVAIDSGIKPKLSYKGSSGCYFVKNKEKVTTNLMVIDIFCEILFFCFLSGSGHLNLAVLTQHP